MVEASQPGAKRKQEEMLAAELEELRAFRAARKEARRAEWWDRQLREAQERQGATATFAPTQGQEK